MAMFWFLTAAVLLMGTMDLLAIWLGKRTWRYLFKPGTMVAIIALAAMGLPEAGRYGYLILGGLLFSIAGDIFLVLPGGRLLPGLASFFVAHLAYIGAFALPWTFTFPTIDATTAVVLFTVASLLAFRLHPGVMEEGGVAMLVPVLLYVAVISLMVLTAARTRDPLLAVGALLFYLSDAVLAWNRFVKRFAWADLAIMTTYFTAQYLLALSVVRYVL